MIHVSPSELRQSLNDMSSLHARTPSKPLPGCASCSGIICMRMLASHSRKSSQQHIRCSNHGACHWGYKRDDHLCMPCALSLPI